jgi:hypothetical protein
MGTGEYYKSQNAGILELRERQRGRKGNMKAIVATLTAFALAAGLAGHADAASSKKKKKHYNSNHYAKYQGRRDADDSIAGYYEHRLEAVRFGSQRWWKIYDEQNGGSQRR